MKKKRTPEAGRAAAEPGAQAIAVTVEPHLLVEIDALARALGITRAGIIARGPRGV